MPFSGTAPNKSFTRGSGVYSGSTTWQQTEAASRGIRSDDHDTHDQDLAAAINTSLQRDGSNKLLSSIPANGFGMTGMGVLGSVAEITVASATTTDVLGAAALFVAVSGTTTITSLGTGINQIKFVRFTGALTLTHNATSLILPTGANIVTAAGDTMIVESDGSSNARILAYQKADGTPLSYLALLYGSRTAEVTVASATTTDILGAASTFVAISGTTTITSLGTGTNRYRIARFTGALTLTHNATSLILPGAANIVTVAGDCMIVESDGSSNARVVSYMRADGGPVGAGTGTSGQFLKSNGAGSAPSWATVVATQAQMEAASSAVVYPTPSTQHFHPGHPKCWAYVSVSGGTPTLTSSYNITSITDNATGDLTITIATDFSSASWCALVSVEDDTTPKNAATACWVRALAAGTVQLNYSNEDADALRDPASWHFVGFGDQA